MAVTVGNKAASVKSYACEKFLNRKSFRDVCKFLSLLIFSLSIMTRSASGNLYNIKGGRNSMLRTRVISTRYGKLQGVILPMDQHKFLKPVEVYLGVPYATPPIGINR